MKKLYAFIIILFATVALAFAGNNVYATDLTTTIITETTDTGSENLDFFTDLTTNLTFDKVMTIVDFLIFIVGVIVVAKQRVEVAVAKTLAKRATEEKDEAYGILEMTLATNEANTTTLNKIVQASKMTTADKADIALNTAKTLDTIATTRAKLAAKGSTVLGVISQVKTEVTDGFETAKSLAANAGEILEEGKEVVTGAITTGRTIINSIIKPKL